MFIGKLWLWRQIISTKLHRMHYFVYLYLSDNRSNCSYIRWQNFFLVKKNNRSCSTFQFVPVVPTDLAVLIPAVKDVREKHVTMSVGTVAVKMDGQGRSVQNVCVIRCSIYQKQWLILKLNRFGKPIVSQQLGFLCRLLVK